MVAQSDGTVAMTDPLAFVLAVVAILGTPGPTNTLLFTSGATVGVLRSVTLLLGEVLAYNSSVAIVGFLLQPLIDDLPWVRVVVRIAIAAYLVMLAIGIWRANVVAERRVVTVTHVFLTTLLNPKVFVFALVIIPLQAPNVMTYLAGFSLTVMLIGGTWICFGSLAGSATGRYAAARLVPRTAAIVLVGFAALIASPVIH